MGGVDSPRHTWTAGWGPTSPRLHFPPLSPCAVPESSGFYFYRSPSLDSSLCFFHTHTSAHSLCSQTLRTCERNKSTYSVNNLQKREDRWRLLLIFLCQGAWLLPLPVKVPNCLIMNPIKLATKKRLFRPLGSNGAIVLYSGTSFRDALKTGHHVLTLFKRRRGDVKGHLSALYGPRPEKVKAQSKLLSPDFHLCQKKLANMS